jgi:hypothetical protein
MRTVRLPGLAFLAESQLSIRFNGEARGRGSRLCRKRAVSLITRRSSRTRKDSCRVGPVEEEVEDDSEKGGPVAFSSQYSASSKGKGQDTYPKGLGRQEANGSFNPNGPRRNTVYEDQREIGCAEAAVSFALPGPFSRHSRG